MGCGFGGGRMKLAIFFSRNDANWDCQGERDFLSHAFC